MEEILSGVLALAGLGIGLAAVVTMVRKAGFPSGWLSLFLLLGPFALLVYVFRQWPIERELAFYRLRDGAGPQELAATVEGYALDLERQGDWARATFVYEELARRLPNEAAYYLGCIQRLGKRLDGEF